MKKNTVRREMAAFEWAQLWEQLGSEPLCIDSAKLSDISSIISAKQFSSSLVTTYFNSYFCDIQKRYIACRKKGIKKFNAPRGVHFCPQRGGYFGIVSLFGERIEIPVHADADAVAELRLRLTKKSAALAHRSAEDRAVFASRVKEALAKGPSVKRSEQEQPMVGIITPDPGEPGTPVKRSLRTGTPLSAPERLGSSNEPEILKFRDKFYCRYQVVGEFLSSPMRQTRSEAEADFLAILDELERLSDRLIVMEMSPVERSDLLSHFRTFNLKHHPPRTPQTEAHRTSAASEQAPTSAVKDIFKIRDKFYTSMRLFDQQVSTPLRTTINEALRDRDKLNLEIEGIQNTQFRNNQERSKVVSEIKMRISSSYM